MQLLLQLGKAFLARTLTKEQTLATSKHDCGLPGAYGTLLLSYLPGGPWRYTHCTFLSQPCGETYIPKPPPL